MQSTLSPARTASSLPDRINAAHEACCQATGQAIEHAMRCGDLLAQAKAECKHGQWQNWLTENFSGSVRTAQVYMRLAANREEIESEASKAQRSALSSANWSVAGAIRLLASPKQSEGGLVDQAARHLGIEVDRDLIPPNEGSLLFTREFSDGSKWVVIAPSVHRGYYYVTVVDLTSGELGGGFVEGTKRPVQEKYLRFAIEGLKAMSLVERGERHEVPFTEPQNFNHWMFVDYEHYRQLELAEWKRKAEEAA